MTIEDEQDNIKRICNGKRNLEFQERYEATFALGQSTYSTIRELNRKRLKALESGDGEKYECLSQHAEALKMSIEGVIENLIKIHLEYIEEKKDYWT